MEKVNELFFGFGLRRRCRSSLQGFFAGEFGNSRFERIDPGGKCLVFGARPDGHFACSLEFLALDDIHRVEDFFGLAFEGGFHFSAHALSGAGGVSHQLGKFVENAVRSGRHGKTSWSPIEVMAEPPECKVERIALTQTGPCSMVRAQKHRRESLLSDYLALPLAALPFPNIDPVILQIGPLAVHWYGVAYVVGILFAWWYAKRLAADTRLWSDGASPMKPEDLDDFLVWAAVGVVLGGRIGYILFYDLARYLANPLDIFALWQGGMSFHGGFIGTTLAIVLFARSRGIKIWTMLDIVAAGVPVALGLVRVTNFINSELWGRPSDVPWAFVFPNGGQDARHPSQLYEAALEGLVLWIVLRILTHRFLKLKTPGFIAGAFVTGYGASRIFVEFFREPDQQLGYLFGGWLTMGMVLSLPMVLVGVWAMWRATLSARHSVA